MGSLIELTVWTIAVYIFAAIGALSVLCTAVVVIGILIGNIRWAAKQRRYHRAIMRGDLSQFPRQ